MTSRLARFCMDRCDDQFAAAQHESRTAVEALERKAIVKWMDDNGDPDDVLALGTIAAQHAYHPAYENWPAQDHAEHRNSPATWNDPDGVLT